MMRICINPRYILADDNKLELEQDVHSERRKMDQAMWVREEPKARIRYPARYILPLGISGHEV